MVENTKPMIDANNAKRINNGLINIKQLNVPKITDTIPDNLNKFIL